MDRQPGEFCQDHRWEIPEVSFVKAEVKAPEAENSEIQQTMCQAHGCPNRWSINDGKGKLCRWHHAAEPMDWPGITDQLRRGIEPVVQRQESQQVNTDRLRGVMSEFRSFGKARADKSWAYKLKEREESGEHLNIAQRNAWRAALGVRNDSE